MLIAIEVAVLMSQVLHLAKFPNGINVKRENVEEDDGERGQVFAGTENIKLVKHERPDGVEENPLVTLRVWQVGHRVCLRVDWDFSFEISWMQSKDFVLPVIEGPSAFVPFPPSRFHGVFGSWDCIACFRAVDSFRCGGSHLC